MISLFICSLNMQYLRTLHVKKLRLWDSDIKYTRLILFCMWPQWCKPNQLKEIKVLCEKKCSIQKSNFHVTQIRVKYFDELKGRIKFSKKLKKLVLNKRRPIKIFPSFLTFCFLTFWSLLFRRRTATSPKRTGLRRQSRNQSKLKKFWQEHIFTAPAKIGVLPQIQAEDPRQKFRRNQHSLRPCSKFVKILLNSSDFILAPAGPHMRSRGCRQYSSSF
jgi:hypothetical protein